MDMTPEEQRIAIAELCGWKHRLATIDNPVERDDMRLPNSFGPAVEAWWHDSIEGVYGDSPDYPKDLNAIAKAEALLDDPQYSKSGSSRPDDHAPMRYTAELAKVCGVEMREELVLSCEDRDKGKLNFRPGPYPTPIKLPPSAIVLGHYIPAYGYELCMIRATAEQRAEALLRALGKWKD